MDERTVQYGRRSRNDSDRMCGSRASGMVRSRNTNPNPLQSPMAFRIVWKVREREALSPLTTG